MASGKDKEKDDGKVIILIEAVTNRLWLQMVA